MAQAKTSVSSYIKNVAKSFGYAFGDTFETYNPVISSLVKETKDTTTELYQSIKSISSPDKSIAGSAKNTIDDAFKNIKDDLRTGNWYNKQRKEAAADDMIKALGFDMSDFDFEDWGDDDFSDDSDLTKATIESNENNAKQIIGAMDAVGYQIAGTVSQATMESASYIAESNRQGTIALYGLNQKGFSQVTQALMTVNNSIVSFAKIGEPLTAHMQNSAVFYTKTTETLNRMDQSLQQIVKNTTPAPLATDKRYKAAKGTLDSVLSDGTISIDAYKEMIKENFADSKDMLDMAMGALKSFKSSNGSYGKNISIMTMATQMMSQVLLPKVFKESMKSLNDSLKYALSGGLVKLRNSSSSNLVVELLKDIILPQDGFKSSINVGNYEKGAVAWDGISRKALTEVIPTTLLKIYSAISGEPEMRYDYNSGKFVTVGSIKKAIKDEETRYVKNAGGKFREDALNSVKNKGLTKEQQAQMEKEIEAYFMKAFKKGSGFYDINKSNFNANEFGLTEESLAILQNLLKDYRRSGDSEKRNRANKFVTDIATSRDDFGNEMRRQESTGTSMRVHLQNGSILDSNAKFGLDEYNHSISFYLQGIYQYTGYLADNIDFIAGKSRKTKKRRKLQKGGKVDDILNPVEDIKENSTSSSRLDSFESLFEDEDEKARKDKEEKYKNLGKEAENKTKDIKSRLKDIFGKFSPKAIKSMYEKPFESTANLLNSIGFSLDKLLWGKEDGDDAEQGIFGYIMTHTKDALNKFNDFIDKQFGVNMKQKMAEFWDYLWGAKDENGKRQGGKFKDFREQTVENLKGAGKWFKDGVTDFWKGKPGAGATQDMQAAHGRRVTKTGIVAVSEGELIIPSELNPFYHGITNKSAQVRNERNAISKFYGSFADGGTVGNDDREGGFSKLFFDGIKTLFGGIYQFASEATVGKKDEATAKKDKGIISEITKKVLKEAGDNAGAIGAGALIGGGVSVLTGAVVGPLFGAAIGGAVGLTIKSKTIQKILFGETDEDGNLEGGILNKEVSNFLVKNVPSMAKGAALGGTAGLFLGSPVLGAILGSTVSYVSSSQKAQEVLFGKLNEDGTWKDGLLPKDFQDKIKSSSTKMAAGAILGMAVGPFGLMGNLVLGAGLGYLADSKNFHEYMFGDGKDDKGLAGMFKDKIFNNLDIIFHNMGNAIKGWSSNLIKETSERLKDFFTKRARAYENGEAQGPLGKLIGGAVSLTGRAVKGTTNFVGNRLAGLASRTQAYNLKRGYGVYSREEGRNMFASERMGARGGSTKGTFGTLDSILSQAGSKEELSQLKAQLEDARDPSRAFKRTTNTTMAKLYAALEGMDPKKATKIARLVQKGDPKALQTITKMLNEQERQQYLPAINEALQGMSTAKNSKGYSKDIIKKFADQGINISKAGNLNAAIDQINYEMKNGKFSPEVIARNEEKTWRERVLKVFESIDINIARKFGGKTADGNEPSKNNKSGKNIDTSISDFLDRTKGEHEAETKTEIDLLGNIHEYEKTDSGWVEKKNDSSTDKSRSRIDSFIESVNHIPIIGSAIGGLTGLFGQFKDKLLGGEEKEGGLLSKLFSYLNGEDGPLSWLTSIFTNSKIGTITKSLLSKVTLSSIITNVVGPGLLLAGLGGSFDSFAEKATDGAYGKGSSADYYVDQNTGKKISKDNNGNWVDEDGNIVQNPNISSKKGSVASFSDKLKQNTARGILTNTKSVASTVLGKTALGKKATSLGKTIVNTMKNGGGDDIAAMAARMNLGSTITDACKKFTNALKRIPALSTVADKLDDMGLALANKATKTLASEGAESILKLASNAVIWAKIAFVVIDFTTGYEDARTTLGIVDEPTIGQKIISGLLRAVKNFIPVIGSLIPDSLIIDIFCDYIAPALGINPEELMKQREEAQAAVDAYNTANGTNLSVGEYNKSVLQDYTWTERIGNAAKGTWEDTKTKFTNMKEGIKEKGLGGYLSDSIKQMGSNFINSYKENGGGISGVFSAVGDTFKNLLPGVFGDIAKANSDIMAKATKGELAELWKVSLPDFSGGQTNEDGITTAVPGIFSKIVGQIPLIFTKLQATPIALISGIFSKIAGFIDIEGLIGKIKSGIGYLKQQQDYGYNLIHDPDSELSDYFKIDNPDPDNPLGGVMKAVTVITRLTGIPKAIIHKAGSKIFDGISNVANKVKNSFTTLMTGYSSVLKASSQGNVKGIFEVDLDEDPENPVGGFTKFIFKGMQMSQIIPASIMWVGGKIKDGIHSLTENIGSNYETLGTSIDKLKELSKEGKVSEIWKYDLKLKNIDPLKGFWNFTFTLSKIFNVIIAAVSKLVEPLKDTIDAVKDTVGDVTDWVGDKVDNVKEGVKKAGNWVGDKASSAYNAAKKWLAGGASGLSSRGRNNGDFVSQLDPKYKDMRFGNTTIGEKGCAPAVAAMVANKYGRNLSMNKAIQATAGYRNPQGTSADYFSKVLNSQGIGTEYLTGKDVSNKVLQNLINGQPVILLGKDATNDSKDRSPFGPNGHYVVATGLDKNGNIIINDPEGHGPKVYNKSILTKANIGISTSAARGGSVNYDTDVAKKVWAFFTSKGYSPAATAGIMGNMYQESGMRPDRIQGDGTGPAAGIVQWENYNTKSSRWRAMSDYAAKKGYKWTELTPQLEYVDHELNNGMDYYFKLNTKYSGLSQFKTETDPMAATLGFEKAFERAGKPMMENRYKATEQYYKLYQDSKYTGNWTAEDPSGSLGSGLTATDNSGSSVTDIISAIGTAFSSALGSIFSIGDSSGTANYSDGSSVNLGNVPEGKGNAKQKKIVQYALSRLGKNQYTQSADRTKVADGWSDCSSFAQWCYKQALGIDPGSWTGAQIQSPLMVKVDQGSKPNLSKLEAGDMMFWKSKNSSDIGHVEIYDGNGNTIGHGSGIGPKKRTVDEYTQIRNNMNGGYAYSMRYKDIANASGGSSGILLNARPGSYVYSGAGSGLSVPNYRKAHLRSFSGGASDINTLTTDMLNNVKNTVVQRGNSGAISADLVQKLIQAIIDVLEKIANNTAPVGQIYEALLSNQVTTATAAKAVEKASNSSSNNSDIDSNIRNLVGTLAALAKG